MTRKPPRKPTEPLATIVFPAGGGRTRMLFESLPRVKEDLELAIVTKFIGALRHEEGRVLEPPTRGDEWPDFVTRENSCSIGIELVEIVNPDHAQKRARQEQYLRDLLPQVEDVAPLLDGIAITLVDGYQEPAWPPVSSDQGKRLIQHVAAHVRVEAGELARIAHGPGICHRWDFERLTVGILAIRGRPISGAPNSGLDLRFSGSFPSDGLELVRTVNDKIDKAYDEYGAGELWLLAHASHAFACDETPVAMTRALLDSRPHPFAAVWGFFPFPGADMGFVVKVFP